MLSFERKYNKERDEENQKVVCFAYHREGHTIQTCFKLSPPPLKNKDGERRQDRKSRHKNDGYKNKKKAKAMQIMWSAESDGSGTDDTNAESRDENELNLDLMARFEKGPSMTDIKGRDTPLLFLPSFQNRSLPILTSISPFSFLSLLAATSPSTHFSLQDHISLLFSSLLHYLYSLYSISLFSLSSLRSYTISAPFCCPLSLLGLFLNPRPKIKKMISGAPLLQL
jgi:hypothetical protein